MNIDDAVLITQERLAQEGQNLGNLLCNLRDRISPSLIGESQWKRILERAETLPIEMGALPFGFEIPLHESKPVADFGVSLASGTRTATFYEELQREDSTDGTANAILNLFQQMESDKSTLRDIVGRKLMLEYDIGSGSDNTNAMPGMFLRPGERPILGLSLIHI